MLYSYNWLKEYITKLPSSQKLADLLTMHSFEVEDVQKKGNDYIFSIDVLPNRMPDVSGHLGLAREIAALTGSKIKESTVKRHKLPELNKKQLDIKIKEKDAVPRYFAILILDVKIGPSPAWLKKHLASLGIKSINNVVDITNFVMHELGQPLHIFDYDKIGGGQMAIRKAKEGEELITLDGIKRKLPKEILVIADKNRIIDLAGIMGGKNSQVTGQTKNVLLQAANFDSAAIYKSSRLVNYMTDASKRYTSGLDPNLAEPAIYRALELILDLAGGKAEGKIDIYPKPQMPHKIAFEPNKANSILGTAIPEKEMLAIFKNLGFAVQKKKSGKQWIVEVPTIRQDLAIGEDLIEEIGRIYGYENISPQKISGEFLVEESDEAFLLEKTRALSRSAGFSEVHTYSFVGEAELGSVASKWKQRFQVIEVANPIRPEFKYLRPLLLPSLFKGGYEALKYEKNISLFEFNKVYSYKNYKKDAPEIEGARAGYVLAREGDNGEAFFELKGMLDAVFGQMGLDVWYDEAFTPKEFEDVALFLHSSRRAQIKIGNKVIGIMGEIVPNLKKEFKLKGNYVGAELSLFDLIDEAEKEKEFKPVSKYPAVMRDIALLVPLDVKVVEVSDIIENTAGELLVDSDLFDIYEGPELPDGKKSFAFRLIFQSHDKTLRDLEVNKLMDKIIKALEQVDSRWEVRR